MTGLLFDKFPNGTTVQEDRKATRGERTKHEDGIKRQVQIRDHCKCRVPACRDRGEWAHLNHRGMGGNRDGSRSTTGTTLILCRTHHKGPDSLDSARMEVIPLTPQGCDGPLAFHFVRSGKTCREDAKTVRFERAK
jgi:hypothetical protein